MENKCLPTIPSRAKALLLMILMLCLYFLDNPYVAGSFKGAVFAYLVKPVLWLGIALIVLLLPRIHPKGLLRLKDSLNWWAVVFAISYIAFSILAGLIDGFGRSPYSHSIKGILMNIFMVGSVLVGKELGRSYIVNNLTQNENFTKFAVLTIPMTLISIPLNLFLKLSSFKSAVQFAAQYFAPEFCKNLLSVYMVFLGGPVPSIIYNGLLEGLTWLCPILPDLKWITTALIGILCPLFSFNALQDIYMAESGESKPGERKKESTVGFMITSMASIMIVWFSVGVFPIYPSVVATGSMEPVIKPGDVVIVDKKIDTHKLNIGEIIQYKRNDIMVCHRIVEIIGEGNEISYRTKGDNNSEPDSGLVKPDQVIGRVIKVVPKIGWPALLLKSKNGIPLEEVEF